MAVETSMMRRFRPRHALLLLVAGATFAACGTDSPSTAEDEPTPASSSADPADEPTGEPTNGPTNEPSDVPAEQEPTPGQATTPGGDEGSPGAATAPIYYVGDTPQGQRLYREFQVVGGEDVAASSLDALANGVPTDPDYSTLVPAGETVSVEKRAGRIRIVLPKDSVWPERGTLTPKQARLAAQSVVYTVQGALGERRPVQVVLEGGDEPTSLFGFDTARGLAAAPELQVLAHVNITVPAQGQSVPASSFTAEGRASSFEANVPWEIRDDSGAVVDKGFATAEGWMGRLYPWTAEVDLSDLDAGTYTFIARTDDPSGGQEGSGPFQDSKTITVR